MQLVIQSGVEAGKSFELDRPTLVIGRQAGNEIVLADSQVSRRHLQIEQQGSNIIVTDLGSANGSFINGTRLAPNMPQLLNPGDILQVGDTSLKLQAPTYQPSSATYAPQSYASAIPPTFNEPAYQPQSQPAQPVYQSQAPQPAYQPQMTVKATKKSNAGLVIGVIIVAVLLIGGGIGAFVALSGNSSNSSAKVDSTKTVDGGNPPVETVPIATVSTGKSGSSTLPPPPPRRSSMRSPRLSLATTDFSVSPNVIIDLDFYSMLVLEP